MWTGGTSGKLTNMVNLPKGSGKNYRFDHEVGLLLCGGVPPSIRTWTWNGPDLDNRIWTGPYGTFSLFRFFSYTNIKFLFS